MRRIWVLLAVLLVASCAGPDAPEVTPGVTMHMNGSFTSFAGAASSR